MLTNCPDCESPISTEAFVCPKCGRPTAKQQNLGRQTIKRTIWLWIALLVVYTLVHFVMGD